MNYDGFNEIYEFWRWDIESAELEIKEILNREPSGYINCRYPTIDQFIRSYTNQKKKSYEINKARLTTDPSYRFTQGVRSTISGGLRRVEADKLYRSHAYLGCSFDFFKTYIAQKFTSNMNWDNWGSVWELDHIKPVAHPDFKNYFKTGPNNPNYYTNFQPLLKDDNRKKSSVYNGVRYRKQANHSTLSTS